MRHRTLPVSVVVCPCDVCAFCRTSRGAYASCQGRQESLRAASWRASRADRPVACPAAGRPAIRLCVSSCPAISRTGSGRPVAGFTAGGQPLLVPLCTSCPTASLHNRSFCHRMCRHWLSYRRLSRCQPTWRSPPCRWSTCHWPNVAQLSITAVATKVVYPFTAFTGAAAVGG